MLEPIAPRLHQIFTEIPGEIAADAGKKALLYKIASTVCLIAFLVIAAGAIAVSFGLLAPVHPALFVGLFLGSIPLQWGFSTWASTARDWTVLTTSAYQKANILEQVKIWNHVQVNTFLQGHHIEWVQLEPKLDIEQLAPAIATYLYLEHEFQIAHIESALNLENPNASEQLRLAGDNIGHKIFEYQVIPLALQAAVVLEILRHPETELNFESLGKCHPKDADARFHARRRRDESYFTFSNPARTPLTLPQLEEDIATQNINGLHDRLF